MDNEKNISHQVRRIQLPSGKTVDIVNFDVPATEEQQGELHRCPECRSEFVYPTRWSEASQTTWEVALRCPECDTVREGVFEQTAIDAYDELLDAGTSVLASDLRRLTRANMAEEGARFFAALAVDAILPEDF